MWLPGSFGLSLLSWQPGQEILKSVKSWFNPLASRKNELELDISMARQVCLALYPCRAVRATA